MTPGGGAQEWLRVDTQDGRALEVLVHGASDGLPIVLHHGTPGSASPFPPIVRHTDARGLRLVFASRPGYAASTPRPGRSVAGWADDVRTIVDALGIGEFITLGWSGGGPHALATVAALPDRCLAGATIAGVAPYGLGELDWLAGMGAENVKELTLTLQGEQALVPYLLDAALELSDIQPEAVAAALGDLASDVDRAALTGDYAAAVAESFRRAVSSGIAGWRDDDLAFARHWGFELESIARPVAIWQGDEDLMVPFNHGQWLATHIPGARPHLVAGQGHISLAASQVESILDDLLELAGQRATQRR